jgi:glycosyltransferase involved in cell wall biosynthesis
VLFGASVLVVVPARDEAPRILRVLQGMPREVDRVIVVDDASTDGTADIAARHVEVIRHGTNRGVGAAIATGYRRALEVLAGPRDAIVVMAGDGQMDPHDLPAVVRPIAEGAADYVKGDRFQSEDITRVMPRGRYVGGQVFSWLTSRALGMRISDSQCGYTAISREACAALDLDGLWPSYGYPNDLLGQLVARRLRVAEVPVRPVYADEVSRLKLRHLAPIAGLVARAYARRITRRP